MGRRRYGLTDKTAENITGVLNAFMEEKPRKTAFGNYRIEGNELFYRAQSSEDALRWHDAEGFSKARAEIGRLIKENDGKLVDETGKTVLLESLTEKSSSHGLKVQYYDTNLIAVKAQGENGVEFLGNNNVLPLVGRTVSYGHERLNSVDTDIQKMMRSRGYTMIQMNKFSKSDFSTFKMIQKEKPRTITVERPNYYGSKDKITVSVSAMLFQLDGDLYLFDADRRETPHGRVNSFTTKVPLSVSTIDEAYEALKPAEVIKAEKEGLKVVRHGALFFIPVAPPQLPVLTDAEKITLLASQSYLEDEIIRAVTGAQKTPRFEKNAAVDRILANIPKTEVLALTKGKNPSAQRMITLNGTMYVTGKVSCEGRADMVLEQWYTPIVRRGA